MGHENQTTVTRFILLGLSDRPELQTALFILFLTMYLIGLISNSAILLAITTNPTLHTPMYFFIGNLTLVDMCITTATVPKLLAIITLNNNDISFSDCFSQLYFVFAFLGTDSVLLAAMAYDRYVAICNPLHYLMVMNQKVCIQLVVGSWVLAQCNALFHTLMTASHVFCKANQIQNFFCDVPPLLKLSCSDTSFYERMIVVEGIPLGMISVLTIIISYTRIISTILQIRSREGRRKAFNTCSSHIIVVSLFYVSIFFTYVRPASSYSLEKEKVVTVMYTVVTPRLNPFIYSLRNDQMKQALKKVLKVGSPSCNFKKSSFLSEKHI